MQTLQLKFRNHLKLLKPPEVSKPPEISKPPGVSKPHDIPKSSDIPKVDGVPLPVVDPPKTTKERYSKGGREIRSEKKAKMFNTW